MDGAEYVEAPAAKRFAAEGGEKSTQWAGSQSDRTHLALADSTDRARPRNLFRKMALHLQHS